MRARRTIRKRRGEAGIALLIAIFVLLLIGVVAIALIVSGGTETALAGNYRSSTSVYYAAVAGLEEARARLRVNNPNSFQKTAPPGFLPAPGTPFPVCTPVYVINPVAGENVAPWDSTNKYFDQQFGQEFSSVPNCTPQNPSTSAFSVWSPQNSTSPLKGLPFPGPLYKWVRINGVSEQSLNLDTFPYDGLDTKLVYYDGANLTDQTGSGQVQVLEVTALAVLPNGSQKILQYLVAPSPVTLPPFLAALTLSDSPGNNAAYHAPASNSNFLVKGDNYDCNGNHTGGAVAAIGVFQAPDIPTVKAGIQPTPTSVANNYTGSGTAPDVQSIPNALTPAQLNAIVQAIQQSADATIPNGTAAQQGNFLNSLNMSPTNVVTLVVNGDLDLSGWGGTGYGLLLVTGTLYYDPSTSWNGVILVIGNGVLTNRDKRIDGLLSGAVYVANTQSPNLGGGITSFSDDMDGNGIRYSSCWIQKAQPSPGYKVLSFHEIAQ